MPKIKLLSSQEIHKIAAGQVVERPANIVKELVENALDAQATHITIMIHDGGKELIRVIDNGIGMDAQDAHLCLLNHATSKIQSVDDLLAIQTFGFRGEALASIAAVSRLTLITKEAAAQEGVKLVVEENVVIDESLVAAQTGTDIMVQDLFFNIPARKKFLKKRETECRHIMQLVQAIALSYPHLHIQLQSDNQEIINCPPAHSLKERCAQLWHQIDMHTLHEIEMHRDKSGSVTGIITDQQFLRYDRSALFFLVNNRWVSNFSLGNALLKGYDNLLPKGRYPFAAIHITCDPQLVDVNIHPRKEEVRFLHPKIIESLIEQAVKQSLHQSVSTNLQASTTLSSSIVMPALQQPLQTKFYHLEEQTKPAVTPQLWDQLLQQVQMRPSHAEGKHVETTTPETVPTESASLTHQHSFMTESTIPGATYQTTAATYRLIGQYKKTYLLLEHDEGLYIIDQHAAHERILYEKFRHYFQNPVTTTLLFPLIISMSPAEIDLLQNYAQCLHRAGIIAEPFGVDQLIITATPVCAPHIAYDEIVRQVVSWITQEKEVEQQTIENTIHKKMHAQMACKAAVKAGDSLTQQTMEQLLIDLYNCPDHATCPHGRPTSWLLPLQDLEKKFKRNYKN